MDISRKLAKARANPALAFREGVALGKGLLYRMGFLLNPRVVIGPGLRAHTLPRIIGPGRVVIGAKVDFQRSFLRRPCILTHTRDSVVVIGRGSVLYGTRISCVKSVRVGSDVSFASTTIVDSDVLPHANLSVDSKWVDEHARPIVIGDRVWLGINSFVLAGTELGDDCVVGAGAVVQGLSAPNASLLLGNPARRIGSTRSA